MDANFDEKWKTIEERFTNVNIEDDVLVVWPSPNLQSSLDYDSLGARLCGDHKKYRYLVVWFMDSSLYRSTKKMELLNSYICIK